MDAVRYRDQMRVQADAENPRICCCLGLEAAQRVFGAFEHLAGGVALDGIDDGIVDFEIVWHRQQRAMSRGHPGWQIVDHPITDIVDASLF